MCYERVKEPCTVRCAIRCVDWEFRDEASSFSQKGSAPVHFLNGVSYLSNGGERNGTGIIFTGWQRWMCRHKEVADWMHSDAGEVNLSFT